MWWLSSPPRCRFSLGNADAGQRNPGWQVARWKGTIRLSSRRCLRSFHLHARAGHWPSLCEFDDAKPWTSSTLSGRSDCGRAAQFMLSRSEREREHHQRDAEKEGVSSQPPGEHNRADQRRDDKKHAICKRQQAAQNQPPPAVIDVQLEASSRHQSTRDDRPCSNQPDERNNGKGRPEKGHDADGDIEQPFEYQQSPAVLLAADRPHCRDDSEYAVEQHIGGEEDHQRQYCRARKDQRDASEDNAESASQRE